MITRYPVIFCTILSMLIAHGSLRAQYERKSLHAIRVEQVPKMDGLLDDACWQMAAVAGDFVMDTPNPGVPLSQKTEVRLIYHDDAIYIGFMCFDSSPDSILYELCGRDQTCNTDYAGVTFS